LQRGDLISTVAVDGIKDDQVRQDIIQSVKHLISGIEDGVNVDYANDDIFYALNIAA